ncbi:PilN domain-containing protein [Pseudomonas sp. Gutcm_11s]|uniref:PilN domain-containing protein n=1 Tax=Pseudomonas sp. Gutcm_11s TaxID=3026088 RepID=UPI00235DD02A|nr:PilN domain-containing protein [Pseudomonas sp. Gutcm_11s]MDD0842159.1 PilN domain-containing protein [Pseudomonas sp. Gutcm_11s]
MQNINLYQVERQRRDGPEKAQMLLGLVLLGLLCLLHAAWQGWQWRSAGQLQVEAESKAQQQENSLAAARASFIEPHLDEQLPAELATQEARNRELQRLMTYLQTLAQQHRAGFTAPLQALADQHPQGGLWLNGIHLSDGGTQLRLQGRSQNQELLPAYLDALGASPVFKGREFARLDVKRGEDQLLDFDLSSRPADQEKKADE